MTIKNLDLETLTQAERNRMRESLESEERFIERVKHHLSANIDPHGAYFLGALYSLARRHKHWPPDGVVDAIAEVKSMEHGEKALALVEGYAYAR